MYQRRFPWLILPLLLVAIFNTALLAAEPQLRQRNILLLNSYHQGYKWTDDLTQGVLSGLAAQSKQAKVYIEYMGTKWNADPAYLGQLRHTYRHKYAQIPFDIIIAADNDAFDFLRAYRDELFGRVPTVFCGLNFLQPEALAGFDLYTGTSETVDFEDNLDLLLRLHPAVNQIAIITDTSITGQQILREVKACISKYPRQLSFIFLNNLPMEELLAELARLPDNTLALHGTFLRDSTGRVFEYDESVGLISRASRVPVYGTWDFNLGHGIVGGKLTSGCDQGKLAGEQATRILQGEQPADIPVVMKSPGHFMFDYNQLQRWNIEPEKLPEESTIINRPSSSYNISKIAVWSFFGAELVFVGFIIAHLYNRRQRDLARTRLLESENQYHSLVDNLNVGIYRCTIGSEGRFLQANPAMVKLFGFKSLDDLLCAPIATLYQNRDDRAVVTKELEQQGLIKDRELLLKKGDGTPIRVSCTAKVSYNEHNKPQWIDGVLEDITEKKLLEEQLRQSQKMESLGTLAGGIAHDFNNILMVISGYCTLLKIKMGDDPEFDRHINPILSSTEKAAQLTQSLLAFSRKQLLNPKPIDLNKVVDGMGQLLRRLIGEDIELHSQLLTQQLTILADRSQMEQILLNLVANARDAMPGGGSISITTEMVDLHQRETLLKHQFQKPGKYAVLSVSDSGSGMDAATLQRIFEPFYSTKPVGKGTGLGLAMVHGIVKQHDGDIGVYSEPGKGTTFKIYLPLLQDSKASDEAVSLPEAIGGTETILLGEDDEQVRQWITEVLTQVGYTVIEAGNGEELVDRFREAIRVDLVVLDVVMPKKNGREAMDEIETIRPDIKALFISGYTADIIHRKGILDQSLNFLSKPMTREALLHKIREVLDQHDSSEPTVR
jgi:two-component system, cell cycle sensor histidine kinase and response regulator CckA